MGRRPLLGVWGAVCFVIALGAVVGREGAVPDPLVAGAAGPLAFFCGFRARGNCIVEADFGRKVVVGVMELGRNGKQGLTKHVEHHP